MKINFNFDKKIGKIKPMHAVGQPPFGVSDNGIDGSMLHYLTEANIPYSRLHDTGGHFAENLFVDIPNLFRDFNADESLENTGILCVFRVFQTAQLEQKIRQLPKAIYSEFPLYYTRKTLYCQQYRYIAG